jgi:hypothetical protein
LLVGRKQLWIEFVTTNIQFWLLSYITMSFIYNWSIVLNNDESHIDCLIT